MSAGVFNLLIYSFELKFVFGGYHLFRRLWLNDTSYIAKVSEEVNRTCRPRNTTVQLSTPYTNSERHNTCRHRQTDRQTDRQLLSISDCCPKISPKSSKINVSAADASDLKSRHMAPPIMFF